MFEDANEGYAYGPHRCDLAAERFLNEERDELLLNAARSTVSAGGVDAWRFHGASTSTGVLVR